MANVYGCNADLYVMKQNQICFFFKYVYKSFAHLNSVTLPNVLVNFYELERIKREEEKKCDQEIHGEIR